MFWRLWRILNRRATQRFGELEARLGLRAATGRVMLWGAFGGVYAVWCSYGLIMLWLWQHTRKHDDLLILLFLCAWFLIGAIQGAWLGSVIGFAWAMRVAKRAQSAFRACLINSIVYLALLTTLLSSIPERYRIQMLLILSALPVFATCAMLVWSLTGLFTAQLPGE